MTQSWTERQAQSRREQHAYETKQLDDFVPPTGHDTWASYVPARTHPEFKLHRNRGQARGAVGLPHWDGGVRGGLIYTLEDGAWKVHERVEPHTPADDLPWRQHG
jgi:hypothetical protein